MPSFRKEETRFRSDVIDATLLRWEMQILNTAFSFVSAVEDVITLTCRFTHKGDRVNCRRYREKKRFSRTI
jgi:hypothetical protein